MKTDNELIAEFMGVQNVFEHPKYGTYQAVDETGYIDWVDCGISSLNYHNNWNLLMPVVEKIKNMDWESMLFGTKRYMVTGKTLGTPIQDAYKAVVEFIKWHNNQQSNG